MHSTTLEYMATTVNAIYQSSDGVSHLLSRRAAGHSVASMAREMRVSRVAMHYWLTGARVPSPALLLLAELLWGGRQAGDWPNLSEEAE